LGLLPLGNGLDHAIAAQLFERLGRLRDGGVGELVHAEDRRQAQPPGGVTDQLADRDGVQMQIIQQPAVVLDRGHRQLGPFGDEGAHQFQRRGHAGGVRRCGALSEGIGAMALRGRKGAAAGDDAGSSETGACSQGLAKNLAGSRGEGARKPSAIQRGPRQWHAQHKGHRRGEPESPQRVAACIQRDHRVRLAFAGQAGESLAGPTSIHRSTSGAATPRASLNRTGEVTCRHSNWRKS